MNQNQHVLRIGPAGISESFYADGVKSTAQAVTRQRDLGLTAFECPFGRGVTMTNDSAREVRQAAWEHDIAISAHAPYYVNLASPDEAQIEKSIAYLIKAGTMLDRAGGHRLVVHVGSPKGQERRWAVDACIQNLKKARQAMMEEGLQDIRLCLETMGKPGQIGTLEEILIMVQTDDSFLPCVDFAHLHAISLGGLPDAAAFERVLDQMEEALGLARARLSHFHFSRIEYGAKGEIRHRTFAEEDYGPNHEDLLPLLIARGYQGNLICESRGTMAEDAASMMRTYESLLIKDQ